MWFSPLSIKQNSILLLTLVSSINHSGTSPGVDAAAIEKRLPIAPVPSQAQCDAALANPGKPCLFYTGGTFPSAGLIADARGYALITDPALDVNGWTQELDGSPLRNAYPSFVEPGYAVWEDDQIDQFWDQISASMAKVCTGVVYVALGPDLSVPANSVFLNFELPQIRNNIAAGTVSSLIAIPVSVGQPGSTMLEGPQIQLLPCPPGINVPP